MKKVTSDGCHTPKIFRPYSSFLNYQNDSSNGVYEKNIHDKHDIEILSYNYVLSYVVLNESRAKVLLQILHWKSFLPLCTNTCDIKLLIWVKILLKMLHLYGLIPAWILLCMFKLDFFVKNFLQTSKINAFVLVLKVSLLKTEN